MSSASRGKKKSTPRRAAFRAGTIALVGRPNVGKSTLLNAMLKERIAITSHHPQTTRDRIAGIVTTKAAQYVFHDTPGVHAARNRLGQRMNDVAVGTAASCDVIVLVVATPPMEGLGGEAPKPGASSSGVRTSLTQRVHPDDVRALGAIPPDKRVVLVVNKIDLVKEKAKLFEYLTAYGALHDFAAIVPVSARKRDGIDRLFDVLAELLPEGEPLFAEDDLSDRPVRFFVAELVREQVLARTRQEVPHGVAVTVDAFEETKKLTRITISVHVAKESHKGILIGDKGKMLGAIGAAARGRAERLLGCKVHLDIHVRATPGWFDDAARLVELGYGADAVAGKDRPKRAAGARPR